MTTNGRGGPAWATVEEPRRWWQKRRHRVVCECGWRSEPVAVDSSGLGDLQLTFAGVDHRVTTRYRCMAQSDGTA